MLCKFLLLLVLQVVITTCQNATQIVDVLMHLSSETETTLRSIQNFYNTYNQLLHGHLHDDAPTQLSFLSMNQLSSRSYTDVGISKYNVGNIATINYNNYHSQYVQQYFELKQKEDYLAVHRLLGTINGKLVKLSGRNGNWAYIMPIKRYSDGKEFYFIQLTQTWREYTSNKNSYKAVSELIMFIKKNFPGLYIFVGDFNVQGHEKIFQHFLGDKLYHIVPFYKIATCNDNEGIASPDGLVVAKELYPRIEYSVDPYPGYSYQHFIVTAKMYQGNQPEQLVAKLHPNYMKYLETVIAKRGYRASFVNNSGAFNPNDSSMIGSLGNIGTAELQNSNGPIVYVV